MPWLMRSLLFIPARQLLQALALKTFSRDLMSSASSWLPVGNKHFVLRSKIFGGNQ